MSRALQVALGGVMLAGVAVAVMYSGAAAASEGGEVDSATGDGGSAGLVDWTGYLGTLPDVLQTENGGYVNDMTAEKNIQAFIKMIRVGEGSADANGYRRLVGGGEFNSFATHPTFNFEEFPQGGPRSFKSKPGFYSKATDSTAAGAYQILSTTWQRAQAALGLPNFSPACQDRAAVWLIQQRGALADVEMGRFDRAVEKCSWEWASLPPARYGQRVVTLAQARAEYERNGGAYA